MFKVVHFQLPTEIWDLSKQIMNLVLSNQASKFVLEDLADQCEKLIEPLEKYFGTLKYSKPRRFITDYLRAKFLN
jgi:hypothetical protein